MIKNIPITPESDPLLRNCSQRVTVVFASAQRFCTAINNSTSYPDNFTLSEVNIHTSAQDAETTSEVTPTTPEQSNKLTNPNIEAARLATDKAFKNQVIEPQA